jgi:hypothetical protein
MEIDKLTSHIRRYSLVYKVLLIVFNIFTIFYFVLYRSHSGYGDDLYYIEAGQRILHGQLVYTEGFRSGTLGAVLLYLFSLVFKFTAAWFLLQLINIYGIFLACFTLIPASKFHYRYAVTLVLLWSAPCREMLFNHQITGILCVLLFGALRFMQKGAPVPSGFLLMIAFDIKPHLVLGPLVFLVCWFRSKRLIGSSVMFLVLSHLFLDLISHRFQERDWFSLLKTVSGGERSVGEKVNFFVLLDRLGVPNNFLYITAWTLFVGSILLIAKFSWDKNYHATVFMVLFSFYFAPYNHLYDFAPVFVFVFIGTKIRVDTIFLVFTLLLIVPQNIFAFQSIFASIFLMLILFGTMALDGNIRIKSQEIIWALLLLSLIHFLNYQLMLDYTALQALTATEIYILFLLALRRAANLRHLESASLDSLQPPDNSPHL